MSFEAEPSAGVVLPDDVKGKERTIYKSGLKYHDQVTRFDYPKKRVGRMADGLFLVYL